MVMMNVIAMDHIVLNVHNMDTMLDFYINVLGLQGERIDAFREGKVPFPSVRISADTLIDLFPMSGQSAAPGPLEKRLNHFCMVIEPAEMPQVVAHLEAHGVTVDEGPATRWGAHGNATSIYFNDPEGNRIEIRHYGDADA
jgi:catechol 2,3-dioxygenase-like lactoylglutathione lyase family enzyme